jgi:periplasmic protein TonB
MRELFRQITDPHSSSRSQRLSALPVSMAVHVAVLLAVVVIPLLATDVLPTVRVGEMVFEVSLPKLPSAPPAPVARRPLPLPVANPNAAPVVPPTGVGRELPTPSLPPDAAPTDENGVITSDVPPGLTAAAITDAPPAPRPVAPVRVHTLLRPPVRLHDVAPVYPELARAARVEGVVIIEAIISTSGSVMEARILRSVALLDQAAIAAVRQWRYTPSLLNGVPVPVVMTVTVRFTLK